MTFTLNPDWLPDKDLLLERNQNIVLPAGYLGRRKEQVLIDLFLDVPAQKLSTLTVIDGLSDSVIVENVSAFYGSVNDTALIYTTAYDETGQLNVTAAAESIYLSKHFGNAAVALIQTMKALRKSHLSYMTPDSPLPEPEAIKKYLITREWFLDENFIPPIDFAWNVAQFWELEDIREALIATQGELKEIMTLMSAGVQPAEILSQVTGKESAIPLSWINQILGNLE